MDVKATQAIEVTDISQTSVKSNDDSTISSTRMLPDVQFDSELSKEINQKNLAYLTPVMTNLILGTFPMYHLIVGQVRRVKLIINAQQKTLLTQQNLIWKILQKRNQIKMKKKRTDHKVLLSSKMLLFSIQ